MAKLIAREGPGRGTVYELVDEVTTIGRDTNNNIQIPSETVSRNHATITRQEDKGREIWVVRDLKSKNGVLVNSHRTESATLNSGDEIRLGETALVFIEREFDAIEASDLTDTGAPLVERAVLGQRAAGARQTVAFTGDAQQRLLALLELGQMAGSARSYSDLFGVITGAIDQNIRPHRTVPILFDAQKGMLRPWVKSGSEFDRRLARMPISSTIVNYVREHRAAILSEATQSDERLRKAQSIATHQIATAMCAPIVIGDRLLGALYVDRLGDGERFTKADLELLTAIAVQAAVAIENVRMREEVGRERGIREREARGQYDIVGRCEAMDAVFRFISKAAPAEAGVLIEGESGTGKELVARAIHLNSRRRHQAFEAVNCAAMAPTLLESELFGHVKGAFTGADRDRPGRFELADEGTLFLDEIGELPESSQSKLLRVIETGELRRVGDVKDRKVNVRVVAATNKKLASEVGAGRFREDLYFRLNVLKLALPPLRERSGDIALLAEHFLKQFQEKCGRANLRFDPKALSVLEGYPWPGNVRELRNAVERMVVMSEGETLSAEDIPYEIRTGARAGDLRETTAIPVEDELMTLKDLERLHIGRVMAHTGGNKKEAARILGIDRSTLYAKLKAYGLEGKDEDGKNGE